MTGFVRTQRNAETILAKVDPLWHSMAYTWNSCTGHMPSKEKIMGLADPVWKGLVAIKCWQMEKAMQMHWPGSNLPSGYRQMLADRKSNADASPWLQFALCCASEATSALKYWLQAEKAEKLRVKGIQAPSGSTTPDQRSAFLARPAGLHLALQPVLERGRNRGGLEQRCPPAPAVL
eukprot:1142302-Pelagomonas_calceolata.AAC.10